jgi:DNA polymerase III delta prime subunit
MNKNNEFIPLMERWRPTKFEDIVLDPLNKKILKNIIDTSYFPNLLFYGPPGTGKTTTIMNLINAYQAKLGIKNKDLTIHLNASDERGIDIIRNQISCFVNSKPLFHSGMKFVILDEVDYMTKNAQQALRYLLQNYSNTARFCLICNYISKIDEGLQNEFLRLRFNQLPKEDIIVFLKNISKMEKLNINEKSLNSIQQLYKSDIRSMINFMQSNQDTFKYKNNEINSNEINSNEINSNENFNIIDNNIWESLSNKLMNNTNLDILIYDIHDISIKYNIDKKNIIKDYLNYIIRNKPNIISVKFLNFVENLMHAQESNNQTFIYYSLSRLSSFICNDA